MPPTNEDGIYFEGVFKRMLHISDGASLKRVLGEILCCAVEQVLVILCSILKLVLVILGILCSTLEPVLVILCSILESVL